MNLGLNMSTKEVEELVAHGEKALGAFDVGFVTDITNMLSSAISLGLLAFVIFFGIKKYMTWKSIPDTTPTQTKLMICGLIATVCLGVGFVTSEIYTDRNREVGYNNCRLVPESFTIDPKDVDVAFKNSGYDKALVKRFKQVTIDYKSKCVEGLGYERPSF